MILEEYLMNLSSEEFFYGREQEIRQLKGYLESCEPIIIVRGEPAIGKTALTSKVISILDSKLDNKVIDIEVEKGDSLYQYRIFADIVRRIIGNPRNNEEVDNALNSCYNSQNYNENKEIIKSFLWSYYPFKGYRRSGFSDEDLEKLITNSLTDFFSLYSFSSNKPLIIRIQNYERRLLGENKKARF